MSDSFYSKIDEPRVVAAIHAAELRSRGEIRVHIVEAAVDDVLTAGAAAFEKLGMTGTAERNGILIYVAPASRKFAVLGDSGITSTAGAEVLEAIAADMATAFHESRFTDGLVVAVERAGDVLAAHFPPKGDSSDANELSNEISRG